MGGGLDLLVIMAHPDDAELLCGGALIKSAAAGKRVGVLDLTAGEMGSSGSIEQRAEEALTRRGAALATGGAARQGRVSKPARLNSVRLGATMATSRVWHCTAMPHRAARAQGSLPRRVIAVRQTRAAAGTPPSRHGASDFSFADSRSSQS